MRLPTLQRLIAAKDDGDSILDEYEDWLLAERNRHNRDGWPSENSFKLWGRRFLAMRRRRREFYEIDGIEEFK